MKLDKKKKLLQKRRWRIRKRVKGTSDRPRLSVMFSHKHAYIQCIDDVSGKTLCSLNTTSKGFDDKNFKPTVEGAASLGKQFGELASKVGISEVVFDRGGKSYHGAIKALADAARENLKF